MSQFVQSLESRTLFSVTLPSAALTDFMKLAGDVVAARTDFKSYLPTLHADDTALRTDLKATNLASNKALMAKLHLDELKLFTALRADGMLLLRLDGVAARRAFVDGIRLALHPTDLALRAKVAAEVAAFQAASAAPLAKLGADATALGAIASADLTAIQTANASNSAVTNDVNKIKSDGGAFVTKAGGDLQTVQADVGALVRDLALGA